MTTLNDNRPVRGESFVWLTGLGLAVSITMAAVVLGVILWQGVTAFWPKPVAELTVVHEGVTETVLGEIIQVRDRTVKSGDRVEVHEERQVFTGSKDAFGAAFRWIDTAHISGTSHPLEVIEVERLEYGKAIGRPVALRTAGQPDLAATDPAFPAALRRAVDEANGRWDRIKAIEKGRIGPVSSETRKLEQVLRREPGNAKATARITELKAEYAVLAKEAADLRRLQGNPAFVLRLATGRDQVIPVGKILDYEYPNQHSLVGRAGVFMHRLWNFVSEDPREANTEGGIFPAIFGTFVMTMLMSVCVVPFGVLAAIYLREYAKQGPFVRAVRIAINNLAGVPSIVFGVFGLGFFVYMVGGNIDSLFFSDELPTPTFGTGGIFWAAATLSLMTVPVVIVATEESIAAVSRGAREASLACGASKWQTIQRIVLPGAVPGILTGMILAMARGAGEVAPLMLVGVVKLAPTLPLDLTAPFVHLERKFMHLGFHIYDLGFQSPDSEAARPMVFATTFFLIVLVLVLNLGAIIMRERLRRKFASSAF